MSSKPPSPPPLQENPSPATAAPPEPALPDHAAPTPSPPPGQVTGKPPQADEPPARAPIDGTPGGAGPPPSLSVQEMAISASPALEAAASEEPTSPCPPTLAEASPEATALAASPPPSPQIAEASPEDAPPPSPSPSPPALTPGALPDASSTDSAAMASEEAARAPPALESTDVDPHTAPAPPTPPLKSGQEGLLPQQHPRPPSPTTHPVCVNPEPAQLPPPPPPLADTTYAMPDAASVVAVSSEEAAVSPASALEATDGETDTAPAAPPASESDAEGSFQEPVPRPPPPPMEAEPSSPEMAPPGFEDFKSSQVPLPAPTLPAKTTHSLLEAAATKAVAVPEEVAVSLPILEATDAKTETAPVLPLPLSESGALQQPLLKQPSPIAQADPCSPDMPPPGFENFKSSWLPPPTPLAEITYASSDVVVTNAVAVTLEEAVWPVPALEAMDVETDTKPSLLPLLESKVEGLLEQPLLRPPTPMAQSAPYSPEMAPPGFENFKSPWPPLSNRLSGTAYVLPDAAATKPLAVKLEEAAGPPPALEAMDMDAKHPLLPPLESGVEGSLQGPQPRPPSPTMQDAPCSPDMAPPGFEKFKSSQVLLPSPPLAQTEYTLHNTATTEAVHVSEEAAQPSPALEAMDVNMDTSPSLQPSSEGGAEGSLAQHLPRLPSPKDIGTACSPEMVPSGHENLESVQPLPLPALLPQVQTPDTLADVVAMEAVIVSLEEVHHPPPVLGTMEEGTVPILPPPLESGSEGSLPQLEPQVHSLKAQAVDTPQDAPATNSVAVKLEETAQPPPALEATDTNMDSATTSLPLSENGAEGSFPQVQQQLSSPTAQAAPCSLDFLELLPPPPPPFLNKEMGQMVCGSCRDLLAYPRGAVHVQCAGCRTINLVLEAHEVGNVHCGRCETLLMYPFGAPAVKCSLCLFVTEIGERKVRPRISVEQAVPPHLPEVTNQG